MASAAAAVIFGQHSNPNKHKPSIQSDFRDLVSRSSSLPIQATRRNNSAKLLNQVASSASAPASQESSTLSSSKNILPNLASITEFMNQVAGLVDSRDIMELQLKQDDREVLIRKKEALPPPPAPPMMMMQSSQPHAICQSQTPPAQAAPPPSAPAMAPPPALPASARPKSSHPPLKSPMAGTFYRAPAFVKVGDKVQKGQVICIIEAMKLMNEIEADQSGTIVDIIAEDGKPVSLDTHLLVIEP